MNTAMQRLIQQLPESENGVQIDAALVTSEKNRFYLTGLSSDAGVVLVTRGQAYLLVDFRYFEAAQRQVTACQVMLFTRLAETLKELLKRHGIKTVLMESEGLSLADAKAYEKIFSQAGAVPIEDDTLDILLRGLRAVKSPEEIEKINRAQQITDAAFSHVLPKIRPGVTERELALEIEFFMRRQGAQGVAFDLIVVSGTNGSMCHGVPSRKAIEAGDFVTMDIGALLDGYHSDMTRTVAVGYVSPEQKDVYNTVLHAQLAAISAVKPGVVCSEVDRAARDIIEKDYPNAFGHSTGHSVGVEIHEWPNFSFRCQAEIKPGMVITVEPGIYLPGKFGVRIEDLIVVNHNGCEDLTHSPKELLVL